MARPHMIQSLRSNLSSEEKKKNLILIHSASTFLLHESKREVVVPIHQKIGLLQRMYHVDISFLCHFRLAWLGCYFVWKTQMVLYLARRGSRKVHKAEEGKVFQKKLACQKQQWYPFLKKKRLGMDFYTVKRSLIYH